MVTPILHPRTWDMERGESGIQGQFKIHEAPSQKVKAFQWLFI